MARSHPQLHARTRAARRALRSTTRSRTDSSSTRAVPMPIDSGSSRRVHCVRRSLGPSGSATRAPTRTQHCTFERGRSTAPTGLHSSLVPAHSAELDRLGRLLVRSPSEPCPRAVACDALPPAGCMPVVKHSGTDLLASRTPCQLARSRGALCLRAQHERGAGRLHSTGSSGRERAYRVAKCGTRASVTAHVRDAAGITDGIATKLGCHARAARPSAHRCNTGGCSWVKRMRTAGAQRRPRTAVVCSRHEHS